MEYQRLNVWTTKLKIRKFGICDFVKELEQLAEQGAPIAQNKLAICYKNGNRSRKSIKQAVPWFTKAAKQVIVQPKQLRSTVGRTRNEMPFLNYETHRSCSSNHSQGR